MARPGVGTLAKKTVLISGFFGSAISAPSFRRRAFAARSAVLRAPAALRAAARLRETRRAVREEAPRSTSEGPGIAASSRPTTCASAGACSAAGGLFDWGVIGFRRRPPARAEESVPADCLRSWPTRRFCRIAVAKMAVSYLSPESGITLAPRRGATPQHTERRDLFSDVLPSPVARSSRPRACESVLCRGRSLRYVGIGIGIVGLGRRQVAHCAALLDGTPLAQLAHALVEVFVPARSQ